MGNAQKQTNKTTCYERVADEQVVLRLVPALGSGAAKWCFRECDGV